MLLFCSSRGCWSGTQNAPMLHSFSRGHITRCTVMKKLSLKSTTPLRERTGRNIVPSARAFLQKKGSGTEIAPRSSKRGESSRNCLRRNLRIPGTFSTTSLTFLVHSATMKLQSNIIKLQPNSINDNHQIGRAHV